MAFGSRRKERQRRLSPDPGPHRRLSRVAVRKDDGGVTVKGSYRIARIGDIDIGVHYSWIFVFLLVAWTLASGVFPAEFPNLDSTTYWTMGVASSLLLFASVLVHELAHSFVAESKGLRVRDITLFIFGGVSNLREEPRSAGDELLISVVGPVASLVLAAVFWVIAGATSFPDSVNGVLGYLAGINLILGVFNLIPGFPLDGGRVLRAMLWARTGSLEKATRIAVGAGRAVALLFVLAGLFTIVSAGSFINGIWLIFIGWFLDNAAEANGQQAEAMEKFRGVTVERLMHPEPRVVEPGTSLAELVWLHLLESGQRAVPVAENGRLVGMVTLKEIKEIPQDRWPESTVSDVMTGVDEVRTVKPNDTAATALRLMNESEAEALPVVQEDNRLIGVVRRDDLARYLQIRRELGVPASDHEDQQRAA